MSTKWFHRTLFLLLIIFMSMAFYKLSRESIQNIRGLPKAAPLHLLSLQGEELSAEEPLIGFNPVFAVSSESEIFFTLDGEPYYPQLFLEYPEKKWLVVLPEDFGSDLKTELCALKKPSFTQCYTFQKRDHEEVLLKPSALVRPFQEGSVKLPNLLSIELASSDKTTFDASKKTAYDESSEGSFFEAAFIAHSYFNEAITVSVTLLEKNFSITHELSPRQSAEIALPFASLPYGNYHLKVALNLPHKKSIGDIIFPFEYKEKPLVKRIFKNS